MKRTCLAMLALTTALVPAALAQDNEAASSQQSTVASQQNQGQPITAASLNNQPIYDQSGQEFGRVANIVQGQGDQTFVVVKAADNRQLLVPTEQLAFTNDRVTIQGGNEQFAEYQEDQKKFQPVGQDQQINLAGAQPEQQQGQQTSQAGSSKIVVQQPSPTVRVEQAAPQVSVQQPQAQVTVQQPRPEILVRQPAPTVTLDIPPPEIIVRMPKPHVNVAMAQPQVEVRQPQPQVQIVQPENQSAVQVQRAQPQVNVQQGQAQVSVQDQGQPQVRYERAEPKVVVNQAQGQPKISFEEMDSGQAQQAQGNSTGQQQATEPQEQALATSNQDNSAQQQSQQRQLTPEQRQAYLQRFGGEPKAQPGSERALNASDIRDMDVWNSQGERIGDVDEVVMLNNKPYVVVAHGGFLGIGENKVAFPMERFALSGENHLVIHGVTEQDIDAMGEWQNQVDVGNSKVADNMQVRLPELQAQAQ